jgi:hypothetical protein
LTRKKPAPHHPGSGEPPATSLLAGVTTPASRRLIMVDNHYQKSGIMKSAVSLLTILSGWPQQKSRVANAALS